MSFCLLFTLFFFDLSDRHGFGTTSGPKMYLKLFCLLAQGGQTEDLADTRSIVLIPLHAQTVDVLNGWKAVEVQQTCGQFRYLIGQNALLERLFTLTDESLLVGHHFVDDAAQGPHIRLLVVRLVFEHFW